MQESTCRRCGFDSWVRKIPWGRKWQPNPVFLPGKSHGHRCLVGYSPWGHKSDRTWWLNHTTEMKHRTWKLSARGVSPEDVGANQVITALSCDFSLSLSHTHTHTHTFSWHSLIQMRHTKILKKTFISLCVRFLKSSQVYGVQNNSYPNPLAPTNIHILTPQRSSTWGWVHGHH